MLSRKVEIRTDRASATNRQGFGDCNTNATDHGKQSPSVTDPDISDAIFAWVENYRALNMEGPVLTRQQSQGLILLDCNVRL
ncbi:hypothetical protein XH80_03340 [Bradyrhizobium sp. CCBAU 45384]|nr:hypothetical protein [Bradyrhizobium sp. CCBAU 45384]